MYAGGAQRTLKGIFRFLTVRKIYWDIRLKRDSDEFGPVNVDRYPQWGIDGVIYGFLCPTYLKELFRKRFGTTMRAWRASSAKK